MTLNLQEIKEDGEHRWAVGFYQCDLTDENDILICETIDTLRKSYGEEMLLNLVEALPVAELEDEGDFQLSHLIVAIRQGMPDPTLEGKKPPALANYRSETLEMVAKNALATIFSFQYPVAAQLTKANANQPILGYDGWGIHEDESGVFTLVLLQVKGTTDVQVPSKQAKDLALECKRLPGETSKLLRALTSIVFLLPSDITQKAVVKMLYEMGKGNFPKIFICPVLIRGTSMVSLEDLSPILEVTNDFSPALGRGLSLSIGVDLTEFGRTVTTRARQVA